VLVTPFNERRDRRERYLDELDGARDASGAAAYEEFIPHGSRGSTSQQRKSPVALARARDTVQRGMSGAQDYLQSHDVEDMIEDARNVARRHPRAAITLFVAVGFILGRVLRRPR
jgi:ElaB/YqjD/DUF883 family membrane-anchored ribosome-binding protein